VRTGSVFGPGSQDVHHIHSWHWSKPPSSGLVTGYVVAFQDDHDLDVFFAVERAPTAIGGVEFSFWLLQDNVQTSADGKFHGEHQTNDLLVVVKVESTHSEVQVFKWEGSHLSPLYSQHASCDDKHDHAPFACAIANHGPIDANGWADISAAHQDVIKPIHFIEGGINVGKVLGSKPAFQSVIFARREGFHSSAQLKDFLLGGFSTQQSTDLCGDGSTADPSVVITQTCYCTEIDSSGALLTYQHNVEVHHNGGSGLTNLVLTTNPEMSMTFEYMPSVFCPYGVLIGSAFYRTTSQTLQTSDTLTGKTSSGKTVTYSNSPITCDISGCAPYAAITLQTTCTVSSDGYYMILTDAICNRGNVALIVSAPTDSTGTTHVEVSSMQTSFTVMPNQCADAASPTIGLSSATSMGTVTVQGQSSLDGSQVSGSQSYQCYAP